MTNIDFQTLSLSSISHRCARESDRFFNNKQDHDPRFCFELFRRAILLKNEMAWNRIYSQYERLVRHWVERHQVYPTSGEEAQFFMNRAFEKMWVGLTPEKFEGFDDLKSILRYLQMCVHSVMVDYVRQKEFKNIIDPIDDMPLMQPKSDANPEWETGIEMERQAFWRWLKEHLKDEREECIIYAMFVLAMKPREVVENFQDIFSDVKEVYRVKENLINRLRRNDGLDQYFEVA